MIKLLIGDTGIGSNCRYNGHFKMVLKTLYNRGGGVSHIDLLKMSDQPILMVQSQCCLVNAQLILGYHHYILTHKNCIIFYLFFIK